LRRGGEGEGSPGRRGEAHGGELIVERDRRGRQPEMRRGATAVRRLARMKGRGDGGEAWCALLLERGAWKGEQRCALAGEGSAWRQGDPGGGGPVERRVDGEGCPVGRHGARPARAGGGSAHA
jgi:hypothetical protein